MTVAALRYPSSYTPGPVPAEAIKGDGVETSPAGLSVSTPVRVADKPGHRYGLWIAVGVSALVHAWAITWARAPALPSPAANAGAVSVAIGSLAFASPQSEPMPIELEDHTPVVQSDPVPTPESGSAPASVPPQAEPTAQPVDSVPLTEASPLPEPVEHEPAPVKKQEIVKKPVAQPSEPHVSEAVTPQPMSSPRSVETINSPSALTASSNTPEHPQDVSMPSAEVTETSVTASSTLPVFITDPDYRSPPRPPTYPQRAVRFGQEGTAMVRAQLSERGDVIDVELRESSGHALLDKAALKAVRQWLFKPATRDGRAVLATVDLPVHFKLQ